MHHGSRDYLCVFTLSCETGRVCDQQDVIWLTLPDQINAHISWIPHEAFVLCAAWALRQLPHVNVR